MRAPTHARPTIGDSHATRRSSNLDRRRPCRALTHRVVLTMITKANYLAACMNQSTDWLRACLANPSPAMRPIHTRIIRLALRKKLSAQR